MLFLRDGAFEVVGIDLVAGVETLKVKHRLDHVLEHSAKRAWAAKTPASFGNLRIRESFDGFRD